MELDYQTKTASRRTPYKLPERDTLHDFRLCFRKPYGLQVITSPSTINLKWFRGFSQAAEGPRSKERVSEVKQDLGDQKGLI